MNQPATRNFDVFPSGLSDETLMFGSEACNCALMKQDSYCVYSTNILQKAINFTEKPIASKGPTKFIDHGLNTLTLLSCMAVDMHTDDHIENKWFLLLCAEAAPGHMIHYGKRQVPIKKGDVILMNALYSHGLSLNGKRDIEYKAGRIAPNDCQKSLKVIGWDYEKKPTQEQVFADLVVIQEMLSHSFMTVFPYTSTIVFK